MYVNSVDTEIDDLGWSYNFKFSKQEDVFHLQYLYRNRNRILCILH